MSTTSSKPTSATPEGKPSATAQAMSWTGTETRQPRQGAGRRPDEHANEQHDWKKELEAAEERREKRDRDRILYTEELTRERNEVCEQRADARNNAAIAANARNAQTWAEHCDKNTEALNRLAAAVEKLSEGR